MTRVWRPPDELRCQHGDADGHALPTVNGSLSEWRSRGPADAISPHAFNWCPRVYLLSEDLLRQFTFSNTPLVPSVGFTTAHDTSISLLLNVTNISPDIITSRRETRLTIIGGN